MCVIIAQTPGGYFAVPDLNSSQRPLIPSALFPLYNWGNHFWTGKLRWQKHTSGLYGSPSL
ncbi:hypothetical protein ACFLYP_04410, partial [Chloroflexota bacterium]